MNWEEYQIGIKNADMTILQRVGDIIRNADQLIMTVKCKSVGSDL